MKSLLLLLFSVLMLPGLATAGDSEFDPELEAWLESDAEPVNKAGTAELAFQEIPAEESDDPPLHSINHLAIDEQSLTTGWVKLQQCYQHLDAVPDAEIQYRYSEIRNLTISSSRAIQHLSLDQQTVQLTGVEKNAELCVKADVRILYSNPDGTYSLRNGPFHRRFLDSYFPYRVSLDIRYPRDRLSLLETRPQAQTGFDVRLSKDRIQIDSYFTGVLNTEVIFTPTAKPLRLPTMLDRSM